ncbi:thioredoxin o1 mitochondrial [Phtheirospermum japonicum]|uniref:Thioredoxin o1 mitochondrial n=1 Tax=Phtheirospermum japonicum TaxID=374723 RepID=A0A830CYD2_9LAMI|nr:thioredoxin o1 mitochondrial [Phtheirospermum japonicum]
MRGVGLMLRRLVGRQAPCLAARSSSSISENIILSSAAASYSTVILTDDRTRPLLLSSIAPVSITGFQGVSINYSRNFSSSSSSDSSKVVSIESEEQFNDSLRKVQDESLPAVFYFTAVWCGPCRLLSPIIGQLAEKYPHVTTYKVDIDKEGLGNALSKLNIHSVPTLHFFQDGKKASEVIGADVQRLKDTMESLYK